MRVDMKLVRALLREIREGKRGGARLSRHALSDLTHSKDSTMPRINAQTIHNIETGKSKEPGFHTIARLVEAMGLTVSDFCRQIEGLPPATLVADHGTTPADPRGRHDPAAPSTAPYTTDDLRTVSEAIGSYLVDAVDRAISARKQAPTPRRKRAGNRARAGTHRRRDS